MTITSKTATAATLFLALAAAACSKPADQAAAPAETAGSGTAYDPATGGTKPAEATPDSATFGDPNRAAPPAADPNATTGPGAGGVTQPPPATPPNTPADGRVDK